MRVKGKKRVHGYKQGWGRRTRPRGSTRVATSPEVSRHTWQHLELLTVTALSSIYWALTLLQALLEVFLWTGLMAQHPTQQTLIENMLKYRGGGCGRGAAQCCEWTNRSWVQGVWPQSHSHCVKYQSLFSGTEVAPQTAILYLVLLSIHPCPSRRHCTVGSLARSRSVMWRKGDVLGREVPQWGESQQHCLKESRKAIPSKEERNSWVCLENIPLVSKTGERLHTPDNPKPFQGAMW